jgi:hypothetical protein
MKSLSYPLQRRRQPRQLTAPIVATIVVGAHSARERLVAFGLNSLTRGFVGV